MRIISKIAKIILTIIVIFAVSLSVLFIALKNGIEINEFDYQDLSIERLYIKIDKKLIINAKNIKLPENSTSSSSEFEVANLNEYFSYLPYLERFFEEINLENLEVGEDTITVLFKDDIFYVDTPYLTIDTQFKARDGGYDIAIYEFLLADFNLAIAGDGHLNFTDNSYIFDGFFLTHEINGKLDFTIKNNLLKYKISNATAKSLKNFMDELGFKAELDKEVKEWIYGKVVAGFYDIEYLKGEIDIANLEYHLDKMEAYGVAYDLNVTFEEALSPINAELSKISLHDGDLHFDLVHPTFEGKDLNGSKVSLVSFMDDDIKVLLDIKTDSIFDQNISNILKAYDINVPVIQKSGKLDSHTSLVIEIEPFFVDVNVTAKLEDANLEIGGAKFYSKKANIFIDNESVVLKDTSLNLKPIFSASNLNGKIDLKNSTAKFKTKFNKIEVENIYKREGLDAEVSLSFKDDINIEVPALDLTLNLGKKTNTISLANLDTLSSHSELLTSLKSSGGSAKITSKNFKDFDIDVKNIGIETPFVKKDGSKYSKDDIKVEFKNGVIDGTTKSGLLSFSLKNGNTFANIKDLDLVLKSDEKGGDSEFPNITFNGVNSNLLLDDRRINFNSYSGNLNKKNIKFDGKVDGGGNIALNLTPQIVSINAQDITSSAVNNLLKSKSFDGGKFNLKLVGDSFSKFQAEILATDTFLTDFVFYQRMLSFLDSIPSLMKLKTPDFNSDGFSVKDGKIYLDRKGDDLHIQAMNFMGTSADIAGTGGVNLKSGELNVDLEIIYLKDASSIIDNIPIINQIILGRDRAFSTIIEIRGTTQEPTYSNRAVSDVLLSPFNIIKNVIELPVSLFD